MADSNIIVGEKIKTIREQKNISIEELSERSGLSAEVIASIEKETSLPSLAPLIKIARGLGVRLGTFLDDNDELGPVVCRENERNAAISFSNGSASANKYMDYFSLAGHKSGRHFEPFFIDIKPCEDKTFVNSAHEGEEFIYVLEGEIEINYGKDIHVLKKGDSIYYDSIVEHHVHAKDGKAAKILATVYTPF